MTLNDVDEVLSGRRPRRYRAGRGRIWSITIETTVHGRGITQRTHVSASRLLRCRPAGADMSVAHRPHRRAVVHLTSEL